MNNLSPPNHKFENNWMSKSLEALEKDYWPEPEYPSKLVTTCHNLRKKPLSDFDIEDLRIMIGQNIGLKFLIPLAIQALQVNILAEGDYYEGDLLKSVLTSDKAYWQVNTDLWIIICGLVEKHRPILDQEAQDFETGRELVKAYEEFKRQQ